MVDRGEDKRGLSYPFYPHESQVVDRGEDKRGLSSVPQCRRVGSHDESQRGYDDEHD